jgi:hypothetical protein
MKTTKIFVLFFSLFFFSIWANNAFALQKNTHFNLNMRITQGNIVLNNYLKNNLNINPDTQKFNDKEIWEIISNGGISEDEPIYIRSMNHFHDPLKIGKMPVSKKLVFHGENPQ